MVEVADVTGAYPEHEDKATEAVEAAILVAVEVVDSACLTPASSLAQRDAHERAVVHQAAAILTTGGEFDLAGYGSDVTVGDVTYVKPAPISPRALRVLQTAGLTAPVWG